MGEPTRIQRKRTRGWRMPPDAIYVGRPTRWGNIWYVGQRTFDPSIGPTFTAKTVTERYRRHVESFSPLPLAQFLAPLRGHDLVCWCQLEDADGNRVPCHADVLLELANR